LAVVAKPIVSAAIAAISVTTYGLAVVRVGAGLGRCLISAAGLVSAAEVRLLRWTRCAAAGIAAVAKTLIAAALISNTLIAAPLIAESCLVTALVELWGAAEIAAAIPACAANSAAATDATRATNSAHSAAATDAARTANSAHSPATTDTARTPNTAEAACATCPVRKLRGPVGIVAVVVTPVAEGVGIRNIGISVVGNAGVVPPAAPGVVPPPAAAAAHCRANHHADSERDEAGGHHCGR
jgi:hypothetical protein